MPENTIFFFKNANDLHIKKFFCLVYYWLMLFIIYFNGFFLVLFCRNIKFSLHVPNTSAQNSICDIFGTCCTLENSNTNGLPYKRL